MRRLEEMLASLCGQDGKVDYFGLDLCRSQSGMVSRHIGISIPGRCEFRAVRFDRGKGWMLVILHHASSLLDQLRQGGTNGSSNDLESGHVPVPVVVRTVGRVDSSKSRSNQFNPVHISVDLKRSNSIPWQSAFRRCIPTNSK